MFILFFELFFHSLQGRIYKETTKRIVWAHNTEGPLSIQRKKYCDNNNYNNNHNIVITVNNKHTTCLSKEV